MASRRSMRKKILQKLLLLTMTINLLAHITGRKARKFWVRQWISRREKLGFSTNIVHELEQEDNAEYRRMFRMDLQAFDNLLGKVALRLTKQDTHMRKAITAREKLQITLRFLSCFLQYFLWYYE
jgi:hypothetical protein